MRVLSYRRAPREPPEPPRLPPPDDLGDEALGELERGDGALIRGAGLLGADGRLIRGELWLLGCRLMRGEGEERGADLISGMRDRPGDGEVVVRGILLEESDPPILGDRDDPRSNRVSGREDEFLSTLDSDRAGGDDVLEERLSRIAGPSSIGLFRCWMVPRSEERVAVSERCGADVVAREPRTEPPLSILLSRGCNLPLDLRSGAE